MSSSPNTPDSNDSHQLSGSIQNLNDSTPLARRFQEAQNNTDTSLDTADMDELSKEFLELDISEDFLLDKSTEDDSEEEIILGLDISEDFLLDEPVATDIQDDSKKEIIPESTTSDDLVKSPSPSKEYPPSIAFQSPTEAPTESPASNKRNIIEKVATLLCFGFLIFCGYYFYNYTNKRFEIIDKEEWASNLPVEGEHISLNSVDTWWGKPQNKAQIGVKLVPYITITLADSNQSGALLVSFHSLEEKYDGTKKTKGDTFPLEVTDGNFTNGTKSITIQGTDGFYKDPLFSQYRNQQEQRWTVNFKERASTKGRNSEFKELGHAPLHPVIKETPASELTE